ncbi:MAG: hypothetical protein J7L39_03405 [Candidatus Aenigmarchaeota archaeon]|nr:hypothetical protein [Candidatus Aenigmarchaeota archaeon]
MVKRSKVRPNAMPKVITISTTLVFILVLLAYLKFSGLITFKPGSAESTTSELENICNSLGEWKSQCLLAATITCKENPAPANCIAAQMFTLTGDLNISEKICKTLEGPAIYFCLAEAVLPDLDLSLEVCNKIEDEYEKVHCRADQLAKMGHIDSALKECDEIDEINVRFLCRASAYSQVDREKAIEECNRILDQKVKAVCLENYGGK